MISKAEFVRLYADEFIHKLTGVVAIVDQKVGHRLDVDEYKTLQDLRDYGYSLDVDRNGKAKVITWNVDEFGTDNVPPEDDPLENPLESTFAALEAALKNGGFKRKNIEADFALDRYLGAAFDPDTFDWGNEDMIK